MTENTPAQETEVSTPTGADFSRDSADGRTLYVLGFSVAGAILVNAILLIYFASL
jgi:hypothetical protein